MVLCYSCIDTINHWINLDTWINIYGIFCQVVKCKFFLLKSYVSIGNKKKGGVEVLPAGTELSIEIFNV